MQTFSWKIENAITKKVLNYHVDAQTKLQDFFDPFPCSSAFSSFLACAPCGSHSRSKDFKPGQCYSEHRALHQCFDVALTKFAVDTNFDVRGRRKWEQLHQVPLWIQKNHQGDESMGKNYQFGFLLYF